MTNAFVDDQLRQLSGSTPLDRQLAVYSDVVDHIDHVLGKVAHAIDTEYALGSSNLPTELKIKRETCLTKIAVLSEKVDKERTEGKTAVNAKNHDYRMRVPHQPSLASAVQEVQGVPAPLAINRAQWSQQWEDGKVQLEQLTSASSLKQYQIDQIAIALSERLPEGQDIAAIAQDFERCKAYVHDTIQEMQDSGMVKGLMNHQKSINIYVPDDDRLEVYEADFISSLEQAILCPHLNIRTQEFRPGGILRFLKVIEDPNSTFSSDVQPAVDKLRDLLRFRQLIPKENVARYEQQSLEGRKNQAEVEGFGHLLERVANAGIADSLIELGTVSQVAQNRHASAQLPDEIHTQLTVMVQQCKQLKQAALSETNLERRSELFKDLKEHSLQVLKMLPAPGSEGAFGEDSLWSHLPKGLRSDTCDQVYQLESMIWDAQMRLGESSISGLDRFMMIKSQAIRQAVLRSEIADARQQVEQKLSQMDSPTPVGRVVKVIDDKVICEWGQLKLEDIDAIQHLLNDDPDVELLALESFTFASLSLDQAIAQDLTAQLSRDPHMEKELLSLYNFVARDRNRGAREVLKNPGHRIAQRKELGGSDKQKIDSLVTKNGLTAKYADQLRKGVVMTQLVSDPDYRLYADSMTTGVSFFESKPDLLLRQKELVIEERHDQDGPFQIKGDDPNIFLASVYPTGHPLTGYYQTDLEGNQYFHGEEGGILPNVPFLPVVEGKNTLSHEFEHDSRIHKRPDIWMKYVAELSQSAPLSISPLALQKLFQIRTDPISRANTQTVTAYGSETAINALTFISDPTNFKYLEHEFVQQFLEESIFGSFVLQQALISYPTQFESLIDLLGDRIQEAQLSERPQVTGFLTNLLVRLNDNAQFAQQNIADQGIFSGLVNGCLPEFMDSDGGAYNESVNAADKYNRAVNGVNVENEPVDDLAIAEPVLNHLDGIHRCVDKLSATIERTEANRITLFEGAAGQRSIDRVRNREALQQNYTLALDQYKRRGVGEFEVNDFTNVLEGLRYLSTPSEHNNELTAWVHQTVVPEFHKLNETDKSYVATQLANGLLKDRGLPPLKDGSRWQQSVDNPSEYNLQALDKQLSIDVLKSNFVGESVSNQSTSKSRLPEQLLAREDVKKALKASDMVTTLSVENGARIYRWQYEGQDFSLRTVGKDVSIERVYDGATYVYQTIEGVLAHSSATGLLADNGIWVDKATKQAFVFANGMRKPQENTTFTVTKNDQNITGIQSLRGQFVSNEPTYDQPSLLAFATPDNVIMMTDEKGKLTHMQLKGTDIEFSKKGDNWTVSRQGSQLGLLAMPKDTDQCKKYFGDNWAEFTIPLTTSTGEAAFIMLPYSQDIDSQGRSTAIQDGKLLKPEILTTQANGSIKGTIASDIYLAHKLLNEAASCKNTAKARALYQQVNDRLRHLKNERLPTDKDQLQAIADIMGMAKDPAISLSPMPKPAALALQIRMSLLIRNLRAGAPELKLSTQENYAEMELLQKFHIAYQKMESSTAVKSIQPGNLAPASKKDINLDAKESAELDRIKMNLANNLVGDADLKTHSGATGRVTTVTEMDRPQHVNPDFLLALVRKAKSPTSVAVDMSTITSPQPLDVLLENFWGYFIAIKDNHHKPENLSFLLQPSTLPPALSAEDERQMKAMDLQARQFLLAYADVQSLFGDNEFNPKKKIQDQLDESKTMALEMQDFSKGLGKLRPAWKQQANTLTDAVGKLSVQGKQVDIPGTDPVRSIEMPDLSKLQKDVKDIEVEVLNFAAELTQAADAAQNLISKYQNEEATLQKDIRKIKAEISEIQTNLENEIEGLAERFEGDDLKQQRSAVTAQANNKISTLNSQLQTLNLGLETFLSQKVADPVTGTQVFVGQITRGTYERNLNLGNLIEIANAYSQMRGEMANAVKGSEQLEALFEGWVELEKCAQQIQDHSFRPVADLSFPEGVNARQILNVLATTPPNEIDKVDLVKKVVRKLGPIKGISFLNKMRRLQKYKVDESTKLFAAPLEGLAHAGRKLGADNKIKIAPKTLANAELPLVVDANNPAFSETQIARLQNLKKSNEPILKQIATALDLSEKSVDAQLTLATNIDLINRVSSENPVRHEGAPVVLPQKTGTFERFENFFDSLSMTPSNAQLNETHVRNILSADNYESAQASIATNFNTPTLLEAGKALDTIAWAKSNRLFLSDQAHQALDNLSNTPDIAAINLAYTALANEVYSKRHEKLVDDLIDNTLPDQIDSQYAQDLKTGLENMKNTNPLPLAHIVGADQLNELDSTLKATKKELSASIRKNEDAVLKRVQVMPLNNMHADVRQAIVSESSRQELLDAIFKAHSKGGFQGELDNDISNLQLDHTSLKVLEGAKFNATTSLDKLQTLVKDREAAVAAYQSCTSDADRQDVMVRLASIETTYLKESNRLKDCLDRCQTTRHLDNLPDVLKPHARSIIYLQNRMGLVLRQDQIDMLEEITSNPSTLKQARMGLGKTTLLPFALKILNERGAAIGMVPRALFSTNFEEMDGTSRTIFEEAGCQFLFSRKDSPQPFTMIQLAGISQKCADFFTAIENKQYILTTIESKASMDDKIIEVEMSQSKLQEQINELSGDNSPDAKIKLTALSQTLIQHETVLGMLYKVKGVFHAETTRIVIDEADNVARANYSVNSEIGSKQGPSPILRDTAFDVFTLIRNHGDLQPLRDSIFSNNQFTLSEGDVNDHLKEIATTWLDQRLSEMPNGTTKTKLSSNKGKIVQWLAGGPSPFTPKDVAELGATSTQLKVLRKTLNSGLRGALELKVGLSADFDPVNFAVGIPASQGVTSATTRFSDPLMQLCLANMISMYKPQGETFLKANAADVLERLQQKIPRLQGSELQNYQTAATTLAAILEDIKQGNNPNLATAMTGQEPWKVALRAEYSNQAAINQMIYVTDGQISRPVQHALRGCNIIGLTGTATRNLSHVITSNGNKSAMDSVQQSGRESTAEVVYRIAKSLPNGLKTPVQTYSMDSELAMDQFKGFAQNNSGYNFLVNQAGACDRYNQKEIVEALHSNGRPIVYLSLETGSKSVMLGNVVKKLDSLNPEERKQVAQKGFYYYHTPHVRGTHFDIPTGSKGALMMSPKLNANDRDQAAYRARELAEGHVVEPFISEVQEQEIRNNNGDNPVVLQDVLKANHNQTHLDEGFEDLSAYQLHLQGQMLSAVEKAKAIIHDTPIARTGDIMLSDEDWKRQHLDVSRERVEVTNLFQRFFTQQGGNDTYLNQLDAELYQGGVISTQSKLVSAANAQIRKVEGLIKEIKKHQGDSPTGPYGIALAEMEKAHNALVAEVTKLNDEWASIEKQLPKEVAASPASQEMAETEVEEEAQEEQEVQSESMGDREAQTRNAAAKGILTKADYGLLQDVKSDFNGRGLDVRDLYRMANGDPARGVVRPMWKPTIYLGSQLEHQMKYAMGTNLQDMRFLVMTPQKTDDSRQRVIALVDPIAGLTAGGVKAAWEEITDMDQQQPTRSVLNGCIIRPTVEPDGSLKLTYEANAAFRSGMQQQFKADEALQAELILTLLHVGVNQLSNEQWLIVQNHWTNLDADEKTALSASLEGSLGQNNPRFHDELKIRLAA
jgi:hypothetical protein